MKQFDVDHLVTTAKPIQHPGKVVNLQFNKGLQAINLGNSL